MQIRKKIEVKIPQDGDFQWFKDSDPEYWATEKVVHDSEGLLWAYIIRTFAEYPIEGYGTEILMTKEQGKWITKMRRYRSCD